MLDSLKNQLANQDLAIEGSMMMQEMAEAVEDSILEDIAIPEEEESKIKSLVDKIPDDDFTTDEKITDEEMAKAADATPDPTIDELLEEV